MRYDKRSRRLRHFAHIMFLAGYIEHWGRGLTMMKNECERVGLPKPIISDNGYMVKVKFMRPVLSKKQQNISQTPVEHQQNTVPNSVLKLLSAIGEGWHSAKELRDAMGFKSKSTFIKNYLSPVLKLEYIQLEDPMNPNSPYQRYGLAEKGKMICKG